MELFDDLDREILAVVQTDGRITNVDLAKAVNLSPPAVHTRLRRLEAHGVVQGYAGLLDREKLGYDMLCFVSVKLQRHHTETVTAFRAAIQAMPEVLECHHVTGEYDYLLKVVIKNRADLEQFVVHRLTPVSGIANIHTSLALSEIKSTTAIPVPK